METNERRDLRKELVRKLTFIRNDGRRRVKFDKKKARKWRKQKAFHHNKSRVRNLVKTRNVRSGYKAPKIIRGIHPSGFEEKLIANIHDLKDINPKLEAVRIRKIGKKNKMAILAEANKLKIKVLNPGV